MTNKQLRFTCPHCKLQGRYDPSKLHILDPRTSHDRPDGRRCLKARRTHRLGPDWSSLPKSNPATALGYE